MPSRTALHTQELILFSSSPASGATPSQRTNSKTARRTSGAAVATPPLPGKARSSSQRRQAPSSSSAATASSCGVNAQPRHPAAAAPEYEPLPEHYRTVPCAPTSFSSEITPAATTSAGASSLQTGHVPSPPLSRSGKDWTHNSYHYSSSGGERGGGIVASGSSSRVVRLLRDARAAVQDPIRPETPLDTYGGPVSLQASGVAASPTFLQRPPQSLEPRLRRRLPVGGRLAPMSSASAASSPSISPLSLVSAGLSSQVEVRAQQQQHHPQQQRQSSGSTTAARETTPTSAFSAAAAVMNGTNGNGATVLDADAFARLYSAAQQRGEEGLLDCVNLLTQLKEWLAAPPSSSATTTAVSRHVLSPAATACLQTTLLHFCEYWPTGAALRNAIDNYSALNGDALDATTTAMATTSDGKRLSRSLSFSLPLNYAEVALLAAAAMLRGYPASSLVAEPVSLHAMLSVLHTVAECGVAEWIVQEPQVVEELMELLHVLAAAAQRDSINRASSEVVTKHRQWTLWLLDIFACCLEEASPASAAAENAVRVEELRSELSLTATQNDNEGQDVIRGYGLADDRPDLSLSLAPAQGQMRVASTSFMSSTASLHRAAQSSASRPGSHSPIGNSVTLQGSSFSVLRHDSSGEGGQRLQRAAMDTRKALSSHLLSLDLLSILQELSTPALASQPATTTTASSSFLPVIASLFRLLAQFNAESLRASGALRTLVSMLQLYASDTPTVESAARALVKLTFDEECLVSMQAMGLTLLDAAADALLTQMRLHADAGSKNSLYLLVSRLCGVVARVAEGSAALQEHLTTPAMTHVLEVLAQRYLSLGDATDDAGNSTGDRRKIASSSLPPTPVLQSIVWVLGIAAMSPRCSLHLVENVTPLLVGLLQRLREAPAAQTTAIYVLMCLSNLSYFFNRFDLPGDNAAAGSAAAAAAATADAASLTHAEWLSTLCNALCFSLAAYLFEDNVEATVEATRILGNISYTNMGRDWMEANRCDEVVVLFLGHEDLRIVYNCCGVLLNLTAASPCRVVAEPELLQMMLSYTSRYTQDASIAAAAALEQERLRQQRQRHGREAEIDAESEDAAEASSSARQVADLVEKLLLNVQGVLSWTAHAEQAQTAA